MIGARFPGRYIQGPGVLTRLSEESATFGDRALCILDLGIAEALEPSRKATQGLVLDILVHGDAEFDRVRAFCQSVRLPTRLSDIGISDATPEKLRLVAERACRIGEIIHNEPFPVTPAKVVTALEALR